MALGGSVDAGVGGPHPRPHLEARLRVGKGRAHLFLTLSILVHTSLTPHTSDLCAGGRYCRPQPAARVSKGRAHCSSVAHGWAGDTGREAGPHRDVWGGRGQGESQVRGEGGLVRGWEGISFRNISFPILPVPHYCPTTPCLSFWCHHLMHACSCPAGKLPSSWTPRSASTSLTCSRSETTPCWRLWSHPLRCPPRFRS